MKAKNYNKFLIQYINVYTKKKKILPSWNVSGILSGIVHCSIRENNYHSKKKVLHLVENCIAYLDNTNELLIYDMHSISLTCKTNLVVLSA
jgi:hypothetical protein